MSDTKAILECMKQFQKFMECSICLDELNDPVETRCGHTFCAKCIYRTLSKKNSVACPLCKKAIRKRSLKKSTYLSTVIDAFQGMKMVSAVEVNSEGDASESFKQLQLSPEKLVETLPVCPEAVATVHPDLNKTPNCHQKTGIPKRAKRTPDLLDVVDNLNRLKNESVCLKPSGDVSCAEKVVTKIPSIDSRENDPNDPFVFPISQNDPVTLLKKRKKIHSKHKKSLSTLPTKLCTTMRKMVGKKRKIFSNTENEPKKTALKIAENIVTDKGTSDSESLDVEEATFFPNKRTKEMETLPNKNSDQEVAAGRKEISCSKPNASNKIKKPRKPRKNCTTAKHVTFPDKYSNDSAPVSDDSDKRASIPKSTEDFPNTTKRVITSDVSSECNNSDHESTPVTATSNQDATEKVSYWLENVNPIQGEDSEENVQADDEMNNPRDGSESEDDLVSVSQAAASPTHSIPRKEREQFSQEISQLKKEAAEKEAAVFGAKPKQRYSARNSSKDVHFYGKTSPNTQEIEDDFKPLKKLKRSSKLKKPNSKQKSRRKGDMNLFNLNGLSQGVSPFTTPTKDENTSEEKDNCDNHDGNFEQTSKTAEVFKSAEHNVQASAEEWSELEKCLKVVEKELVSEDKLEIEHSSLDSSLKPEKEMVCEEIEKDSSMHHGNLSNDTGSQHITSSPQDNGVKHVHFATKDDEKEHGCHFGSKTVHIHDENTSQSSSQQSRPTPADDQPKTTVVEAIVYSEPKVVNATVKENDVIFKVPSDAPLQKTPTKLRAELLSHCSNGIVRLEDMPIICVDETQDGVEVANSYYVETVDTPGNSEGLRLLKPKDQLEKENSSPESPIKRKTVELGIFDFSDQSEGSPEVMSSLQHPAGGKMPRTQQSDRSSLSNKTNSCKERESESVEDEEEAVGGQDTFITSSVGNRRSAAISKPEDGGKQELSESKSMHLMHENTTQVSTEDHLEKESVCQSSEETAAGVIPKVPSASSSSPLALRHERGSSSRNPRIDSSFDSNIIENTEEMTEKRKPVRKSMPVRSRRSLNVPESKKLKSSRITATSAVEKLSNKISIIEETPQVKHVSLNGTKKTKSHKAPKLCLEKNDPHLLRNSQISSTSNEGMVKSVHQAQTSSDSEDDQLTLVQKRNSQASSTRNDTRREANASTTTNLVLTNTQSSGRRPHDAESKNSVKDSNAKEIVKVDESGNYSNTTGVAQIHASKPHEGTNVTIRDDFMEGNSSLTEQQVHERSRTTSLKLAERDTFVLSQNDDSIPSTWPKAASSSKQHVDSEKLLSCGILRNVSVVINKLDEHKLLECSQPCSPTKRKVDAKALESIVASQDTVSSSPLLFAPSQPSGVNEGEQKSSFGSVNQSKTIEKLLRHIKNMKVVCKGLSDSYFPISTKLSELEKEIRKTSASQQYPSSSSSFFVQAKAKRIQHVISSSEEEDEPILHHHPSNDSPEASDDSDVEIYSSLPAAKSKTNNNHLHDKKLSICKDTTDQSKQARSDVITIEEDVISSAPKPTSLKTNTPNEQNFTKLDPPCSNENSQNEMVLRSSSSIVRRKRILSSSDEEELSSKQNGSKKQCTNAPSHLDVGDINPCFTETIPKSLDEADHGGDIAFNQANHTTTTEVIDQVVDSNLSTMHDFPQFPPDETFEDEYGLMKEDVNVEDNDNHPPDRMEDTETIVHDQRLPLDENESACESPPPLTASQVAPPTPPPPFRPLPTSVDTSDVDNLLRRISEITGKAKGTPTSYPDRDVINASSRAIEENIEKTQETQMTTTAVYAESPLNDSTRTTSDDLPKPTDGSGLLDRANTSSSFSPNKSGLSGGDISVCSPSKKLGIMVSGLRGKAVGLVRLFTRKWGGRFHERFVSGDVTHVVVRTQDMRCDRTLKYLQAVASKIWVVSISWITQSLKQKTLLPEDRFEVLGDNLDVSDDISHGPRRSRLSPPSSKLLSGYVVHCIPPFALFTQAQFIELLRLCGARVVSTLEDLDHSREDVVRIITVDPDAYSNDLPNYSELGVKYKAETTSCSWALDCIATYRLQSPSSFPIEDMDSEML